MKKLTTMMLLALLPFAGRAQSKVVANFQQKYANNRHVTQVSINGPVFGFLASLAKYDDSPDARAFANVAAGIKSMQVLQVPYYEAGLSRDEVTSLRHHLTKDGYEDLVTVRDGRERVNIMAQGNEDELRNMLILAEEKDHFTLLSIKGRLSMQDLSYLAENHRNFH